MSKRLDEILAMEGVVIRRIPKKTVDHWLISTENQREFCKRTGKPILIDSRGREYWEYVRENKALGGKYMLTFEHSTDRTVIFYKDGNGIGDTIEEAYEDYIQKVGEIQ